MPVKENNQSPEEQRREARDISQREDELAESLLSSLDLTTQNETDKQKDAQGGKVDSRVKSDKSDKSEEEDSEEEEVKDTKKKDEKDSEDEDSEEDKSEEDKSDEEEEEEEEVIPKSKFQKRLDSEVAKRKVLEAEVAELKAKQQEIKPTDRRSRLESMSEAELKQLKAEAKAEWKRTDDTTRERDLDELLDEIDDVVRSAPNRFLDKQAKAYTSEANKIMSEYDDIDFSTESDKIKEIAINIYKKYPDLHKLERGQATALRMAVEHYSEIRKNISDSSKVKSKETELKRKLTEVKRKTSLDSGSIKGAPDKASRSRDYDRAKKGGFDEKTEFFTKHVINVDKYLPAELR